MGNKKDINKNIKKKLGLNEKIAVVYLNEDEEEKYVMIFNELKQNYSLYEINKDKTYSLLGTGTNPLKLEKKYKIT